jgi:ParB family chromosome partitioning protein
LPEERRDEVINRTLAEQLTVSETENLVNSILVPITVHKVPDRKCAIGDIRIFTNSISKMIGSMRRSGVDAESKKSETENYIEYTIRIPKQKINI